MTKTRFVAKAILLDDDDHFLMLRRSATHPTLAHYEDIPGGTIKKGEEPGAAVQREIFEETGLEVKNLEIRYAVTKLLDGASFPTLLYMGRVSGKKPVVRLSFEHEDYQWLELDKLADIEPHIAPTYRQAFDYMRKYDLLSS